MIRKFASECAETASELPNRDTSLEFDLLVRPETVKRRRIVDENALEHGRQRPRRRVGRAAGRIAEQDRDRAGRKLVLRLRPVSGPLIAGCGEFAARRRSSVAIRKFA